MLEKLGKFLRQLFVYGPKGSESPTASPEPAKDLGSSDNKIEATNPTAKTNSTIADNVVIAPIKKESRAKVENKPTASKAPATKTTKTPATKATKTPATKAPATKTTKTPAVKATKVTKAVKNPKV